MELSENTEEAVMHKNAVQCQKGISLQSFLKRYESEGMWLPYQGNLLQHPRYRVG